jgi:hypothetical protein
MKKLFLVLCLIIGLSVGQAAAQNFRCTVTVSTATTITAVGGDCAGEVGLSHFITSIQASSSAAAVTDADTMLTLKYGTGTNCGTGTTVFWLALHEANTTVNSSPGLEHTPIRIPPENDICWINSTAGTKAWVITGYSAP